MPDSAPTELGEILQTTGTSGGRRSYFSKTGHRRLMYVYEPRCSVCTLSDHEVLTDIHELAEMGTPFGRIFEIAAPAGIKDYSLRRHLNHHVPDYSMFERALRVIGISSGERGDAKKVAGQHASQLIIEMGTHALVNGRVKISASDIIAAARYQHEVEVEDKVVDIHLYAEMMTEVLARFLQAVGMARFNEVMWSLTADQRLNEIMSTIGMNPSQVIEAQEHQSPLRELISTL